MKYYKNKGERENLIDAECINSLFYNRSLMIFKQHKIKCKCFNDNFVQVFTPKGFLVLSLNEFDKHFKIIL